MRTGIEFERGLLEEIKGSGCSKAEIIGAGFLVKSLIQNASENLARSVINRVPEYYNSNAGRKVIVNALSEATPEDTNPLTTKNGKLWSSGNFLTAEYLKHTLTGRQDKMVQDAEVICFLSALTVGAYQNKPKNAAGVIEINSLLRNNLERYANRAVGSKRWKEIAIVALDFVSSPYLEEVIDFTIGHLDKASFQVTKLTSAMTNLLESYFVIKNPDVALQTAKQIYQKRFGLNLDGIKPIELK